MSHRPVTTLLALLLGALAAVTARAEVFHGEGIEVELVAEVTSVQPGVPFRVGLRLAPEPGWKTYWRNPGGAGLSTRLDWTLPAKVAAGPLQWPAPEAFDALGMLSLGYAGEVLLPTRLTPVEELLPGGVVTLRAQANWLACSDVCIPGRATFDLALPVTAEPPHPDPQWRDLFARNTAQIPGSLPRTAATFVLVDGRLQLDLVASTSLFAESRTARFYPLEKRVMALGKPQLVRIEAQRLHLDLPAHRKLTEPPDRLDGVLLVTTASGEQAYEISATAPSPSAAVWSSDGLAAAVASEQGGLVQMLLLALAGGLLLNLMPCVFPVLTLKAINLLECVKVSHHAQRLHGLAYTAGVVLFFVLVAGVLQLLKTTGQSVGWGFQLQAPWFVAVLVYLLFVLGLGFSGLLEIGGRFMGLGETLAKRGGYLGSFFTGALAAVVASPCTAPFMGTAIAYALLQPALHSLLVFVALGTGMALPFLVLAFVPQFARLLPRPGPWMHVFRQAMAFPLYLTAIWLLWVLGRQTDITAVSLVLGGMLLIVFAIWVRHLDLRGASRWRRVNAAVALGAVVVAFALLSAPALRPDAVDQARAAAAPEDPFWTTYNRRRFDDLRATGRPVFINITADWCISCIANERVALSLPTVRAAFRDKGIVAMKGDWSRGDPELTAILESFGRTGVPLYVLYPAGQRAPRLLPQWLTPMNVLEALG